MGGWPRWAVGVKRWLCPNRIDPALVVPSSIHHVPPGPSPDPPSTARPGHATPFSVASPQPCCLPPLGLSALRCLWPRPECTPLVSLVMHDTPRIANTDAFPCHRLHKAIRRVHSVVGRCSTTSRREQLSTSLAFTDAHRSNDRVFETVYGSTRASRCRSRGLSMAIWRACKKCHPTYPVRSSVPVVDPGCECVLITVQVCYSAALPCCCPPACRCSFF